MTIGVLECDRVMMAAINCHSRSRQDQSKTRLTN